MFDSINITVIHHLFVMIVVMVIVLLIVYSLFTVLYLGKAVSFKSIRTVLNCVKSLQWPTMIREKIAKKTILHQSNFGKRISFIVNTISNHCDFFYCAERTYNWLNVSQMFVIIFLMLFEKDQNR